MSTTQSQIEGPQITGASRSLPWGKWGVRATGLIYLAFMIVVPLAAVLENGFKDGLSVLWSDITGRVALPALELTIFAALMVTTVNAIMGTLTAYVLVRYRFAGRGLLNGLVDIPFAIPTLVTGVMLVALYGPQSTIGNWLSGRGVHVIFSTPGIILALLVVTYPFTIRAVQPVLLNAEREQEEAAYTLGASKWITFRRIVLPSIARAITTGALLTFARALGEFGSIVVVAGNVPRRTLTAPVYVYGQIESDNHRAASSMSVLLLAVSFALILGVELMHKRRDGGAS
ncbi:MAG TPA: sulfate ABC transporter permease subunit CysT [Blastocatellia bacterium]|nr:sulfate ABC transporter permease subunit CysT [Blastocatellia bacterium]